MQIQILSDLHFEFHTEDDGVTFIKKLVAARKKDVDVLVIAGDLSLVGKNFLLFSLKKLIKYYEKIIFVPGNHEYYTASSSYNFHSLVEHFDKDSLFVLDNNFVEIEGKKFYGGTLWFDDYVNHYNKGFLNDFTYIGNFEPWVYEKNRQFIHAVKEFKDLDCVISHHSPSYKSVHKDFKDNKLNEFYCNNLDTLVLEVKPKVWCHGHTHKSFDYMIGETRIICNPFGYVWIDENKDFDFCKVVTI